MDNRTEKQKIGDMGEDISCKFLVKHGFKILNRNYRKKWGELDIVAQKDRKIYFVEVKTVSRITSYLPEENVHPWKLKRLGRTIQTYLMEEKIGDETEWQLDVIAVILDFNTRKATIRVIENVII